MKSAKQANPRRSVVIKAVLVYLVVALLVLFISSLIGFYLGGPDGATFALGIGVLINLMVFPMVGLRLMSRLRAMAAEQPTSPYSAPAASAMQTAVPKPQKSKAPTPPSGRPSA